MKRNSRVLKKIIIFHVLLFGFISFFPWNSVKAAEGAVLPVEFEDFLYTVWENSTEEAVARTLGYEKEEEYKIAKETFEEYDAIIKRSIVTLSEVMPTLGSLELDSELKSFYSDFEDEIYNDSREHFVYNTLSDFLDYHIAGYQKKYFETALSGAETLSKCTEIKVSFKMASSASLDEVKALTSEYKKQAENIERNQDVFKDSFLRKYPDIEFVDCSFLENESVNEVFRSFSKEDVTTRFVKNDITYLQLKSTLECYKAHLNEYGKYMKANSDFRKEVDREQADIFRMEYSLSSRKELIESKVNALVSRYETLEKELCSAKEKVLLSKKSLETEQKKYGLGYSTKLLVLEKETELRKNEYNLVSLSAEKIKTEFLIENGILL